LTIDTLASDVLLQQPNFNDLTIYLSKMIPVEKSFTSVPVRLDSSDLEYPVTDFPMGSYPESFEDYNIFAAMIEIFFYE
jgi:hypothetical protein